MPAVAQGKGPQCRGSTQVSTAGFALSCHTMAPAPGAMHEHVAELDVSCGALADGVLLRSSDDAVVSSFQRGLCEVGECLLSEPAGSFK